MANFGVDPVDILVDEADHLAGKLLAEVGDEGRPPLLQELAGPVGLADQPPHRFPAATHSNQHHFRFLTKWVV